MKTLLKMTLN